MITRLAGLARPMLLLMEPERAHETTLRALESGLFSAPAEPDDPRLAVDIWGHRLPNPIGIAAGFDKGGRGRARSSETARRQGAGGGEAESLAGSGD